MRQYVRVAVAIAVGLLAAPMAGQPAGAALAPQRAAAVVPLASAGCGNGCDGKSPYATLLGSNDVPYTCAADARTKESTAYVELRYSPRCRTVWANYAKCPVICENPRVESYTSGGTLRKTAGSDVTGTGGHFGDWTLMLNDAGLLGRACVIWGTAVLDDGTIVDPHTSCTAKY